MTLNQAVFKRMNDIAISRNESLSQMAIKCGINPATLYHLKTRPLLPSLLTVRRLCDGLKMTMSEFFDIDYINMAEFE